MAESTLSLTYADLRREIGRDLGFGRFPAGDGTVQGWEPDQVQDVEDILKSTARLVYYPEPLDGRPQHRWSFLYPIAPPLKTSAAYKTGTVAIVNGVVTLTGGVNPSWAADGELTVLGITYTVNTRDSNTQLTLDDLTVNVAGPKTFELTRPAYTLPDDFGTLTGPLTFRPGTSYRHAPIEIVGEAQIRQMRQSSEWTGLPRVAALRPKTHAGSTGQRWELVLFPSPDAEYELFYRYGVHPNALTDTNRYPYGGMKFGELWIAAARFAAERRLKDPSEWVRKEEYLSQLRAAISADEQDAAPDFLGFNADRSMYSRNPYGGRAGDFDDNLVTFNGTLYS